MKRSLSNFPAGASARRFALSGASATPLALSPLALSLLALSLLGAAASVARAAEPEAGVLDRPVVPLEAPDGTVVTDGNEEALPPEEIRASVRIEQDELETLARPELEQRAEAGERAAQVALGADFAREADELAFAPAAANAALADAAGWYSLAASRDFPGAPSLDEAGVRFYPIRIQRED